MSSIVRTWLVAYDIRDPKRLRRVHRTLRHHGIATQYSVFVVVADDADLDQLLDTMAPLIDPNRDDVRAYAIPARAQVWSFGRTSLPPGIELAGADASTHLLELLGIPAPASRSGAGARAS